jgi:hypothetical protein
MSVLPNCEGEKVIVLKSEVYLNNTVFKNSISISRKTYCVYTENNKWANAVSGNNWFFSWSNKKTHAQRERERECKKNELFLNVKPGGTYSYHCALKG